MTDEHTKRNIAANIRRLLALREPPDNTQAWLARATGETEMRISYYSRGVKMAGGGALKRMAEALGITVDELTEPPPKAGRRKIPA